MKVLIVDDDRFDSDLIAAGFDQANTGAEIIVVNDSRTAVEHCRKICPDLALLDINMPNPDGFEVLKSLNLLPFRAEISVVMLSGSTNPVDRKKAAQLGADGYWVKPDNLIEYKRLADELVRLPKPIA